MTEKTYDEIYRRGDRDLGGRHLSFPGHVVAEATTFDVKTNNRSWYQMFLFVSDRRTSAGDKYVLSTAYKTLWLTDQCELVVSMHKDMDDVVSHLNRLANYDEEWIACRLLEKIRAEQFWPPGQGRVLEWNSVQP